MALYAYVQNAHQRRQNWSDLSRQNKPNGHTAILHNTCNERGLPIDEPNLEEDEDNNHAIPEIHRQQNNTGNTVRNNLIERKL